jgi:hypothetical protein
VFARTVLFRLLSLMLARGTININERKTEGVERRRKQGLLPSDSVFIT